MFPQNRTSIVVSLLTAFSLFACAQEKSGSEGSLRIHSPSFPEVQGMVSKVTASLEIAGRSCPLTVDPDTTLSGRCGGLPLGAHPYALRYLRPDFGVTIGSIEGTVTLEAGEGAEVTLSFPTKNYDDDGDSYTNLMEAMFETDPTDPFSKPSLPLFAPPVFYAAGAKPSALAVGDLNGDAVLDLVATNSGSGTITIRLGNANGTLQAAKEYVTGPIDVESRNPDGIVLGKLGDLNADTNLDVLVINSGAESSHPGDLAVFLGNGNDTVRDADFYPVGDQPVTTALGDLNGDDFLDVVTANFVSENIAVLLGRGDGTFHPAVFYSTGAASSVALGDLNQDSRLDVVVAAFASQALAVLFGNGDGTLQTPVSSTVGIIDSLTLGDLDEDGRLDVAASIFSSSTAAVFLGKGDGTFQPAAFYPAGNNPGSVTLADLDKDGHLDLITENRGGPFVALLLGNGNGTLRSPVFFEAGQSISSVAFGDLNGDGWFDLFATDDAADSVAVLLTQSNN